MSGRPTSDTWIVYPKKNARASLRLFCFPYAGGSPLIFRAWAESLPLSVEVCTVQYPGRGTRLHEKPYTQLLPHVEAIYPALLPHLDKPFAFFGHSMGAIIAFELARALAARNPEHKLAHLFVSGRQAPQIPDTDPITYNLPDDQFIAELQRLNGTPREVLEHPELMQLMLPLLRADFEAIQTYRLTPAPPLDAPITAFGGLHDTDVSSEGLDAWRVQTSAPFISRMLPGDHFFLQTAQTILLQIITRELHKIAG